MQLHHLPASHPVHNPVAVKIAARLGEFASTAGFLFRFAVLSVIAFLFVSAPISPSEVPHANHRPASGL
jgi:hypothetical protein